MRRPTVIVIVALWIAASSAGMAATTQVPPFAQQPPAAGQQDAATNSLHDIYGAMVRLPLAAVLGTALALRPLWEQQRAQAEALAALGEFGLEAGRMIEAMGAPTGPLDALGLGAWLLFALVMYLALRGIARVFSSSRPGATSSSAS